MSDPTKVDLQNRFSSFQISTHTYKVVRDTPILVDILIPKKLLRASSDSVGIKGELETKRPVMVRIHGGWLLLGAREYPPWFSAWALELVLKHDAIIVNPDYRLLPESSTEDILDDMNDLWEWINNDLEDSIHDLDSCQNIGIDLGRVIVFGDSGGGYLSVQAGISWFNPHANPNPKAKEGRLRAVIAAYPMLDLRSPFWTTDYQKQILDFPQFPSSLIDEFLATIPRGPDRPILSNTDPGDARRVPFAVALCQRGRYNKVLGTDNPGKQRRIHPEDRITDGSILPPILFLHGADDTAVPITGTKRFVEHLRKHKAVYGLREGRDDEEVLKFVAPPGEHGYENDLHIGDEEEEWLRESIAFVERQWVG